MARKTWMLEVWALVAALLPSMPASALINADLTPIHLTKQSELILELSFDVPVKGGRAAAIKRALKGKPDGKTVSFNFSTSAYKEQIKALERKIRIHGAAPVIFFVGSGAKVGFMHIDGSWAQFYAGSRVWQFDSISEKMAGTYQGGTDMLIRAIDYILADPDAELPSEESIRWSAAGPRQFAKIEGAANVAQAVDLAGDGILTLFIAADRGDRLFAWDAKAGKLKDVTGDSGLASKSKAAAWGDLNADGRLDLVSWDSAALTVFSRLAAGRFQAGEALPKANLGNGCLALTVLECGPRGQSGVLVTTAAAPVIWLPSREPALRPLEFSPTLAKDLGEPRQCLAADLDGDSIPDVLQVFTKGSLIYRGKAPGQFGPPKPCAVAMNAGKGWACLGDFDGDGLLDVLTVAEDGSGVWQNGGRFQFAESLNLSGEFAYKANTGGIAGLAGDFNNDGRQDIVLMYAQTAPHLFFNRGFRSFGHCNGLDISNGGLLPAAEEGQQAGCLADLNADGAQEFVFILANGECWLFDRDLAGRPGRCVRAALSAEGPYTGPLTVTGWRKDRCLGAWNVAAGVSEAFVAQTKPGPVVLKWQFPGGKPQQREVVLEDRPIRVVLKP